MLPDAYGLMGQARRIEGDLEQAEQLLREAALPHWRLPCAPTAQLMPSGP